MTIDRLMSWQRAICEAAGGFLSVLVADAEMKGAIDVWGMRESGVRVMRAVRRELDGKGGVSPGRLEGLSAMIVF